MTTTRDTAADTADPKKPSRPATAGVVVAFSGAPRHMTLRLERIVRIGRDEEIGALLGDEKLSRHHAEIERRGDTVLVRDLGSKNGTFVNGERVEGTRTIGVPAIVRAGGMLAIVRPDVRSYEGRTVTTEHGVVLGCSSARALEQVARAAERGAPLLITGETGTGKEIAARHFHAKSPKPGGPFIALNCAAIPEGLAERLLFGTKRGAYSGAMGDVAGHVQSAEGGTLFLDEIGELDIAVQAKLLRVLETREVTPLGASAPRVVDVRFCCATHRDLRADIGEGRFRADLFYRLGEHEVALPALRDRQEEIPWLLAHALDVPMHASFVEACLLRPWPGNVRELMREARRAQDRARADGETAVRADHLADLAGGASTRPSVASLGEDEVRRALDSASGNVSAAARALGLHRTQLVRTMKKLGLDR